MNNYKSIIEIGSFSIKTIIYSELDKEYSIIGTGKTRSRGYTGEEIENLDDFTDCLKNSIVQAEKQANYNIKDTYILITNQTVQIKKIQKDLNLNGSIIEKNDLRKISKIKINRNKNFHYNIYLPFLNQVALSYLKKYNHNDHQLTLVNPVYYPNVSSQKNL